MRRRYLLKCRLPIAGIFTLMPLLAGTLVRDAAIRNAELFTAVREGSSSRIRAALDKGASPNAVGDQGMPVLLSAIVNCDQDAVSLILNRGADPNVRSADGATALVLAAGDFAKVVALVEKGADVNARSGTGRTPLAAAAAQRDSYRIVKYLMERGADLSSRDESTDFLSGGKNNTVLMLAAKSRDVRTLRLLLDHGADVNAANSTGATALTEAITARSAAGVRLLLGRGAKVNYQFGQIRQTPLIWASFQECPEAVEALLGAGAEVSAKDALGSTALVWAAMSERDDAATVSALLRAGAKADVTTAMGETPASWAKRRGNTRIVRLLSSMLNADGDNGVVVEAVAGRVARPEAIEQPRFREAVRKGVTALLPAGPVFAKRSGCVSCHNNTLPITAASLARDRGIQIDTQNERQQVNSMVGMTTSFREALLEGSYAVPDVQVSMPYVLMALNAEHRPADELTAAAIHGIATRQLTDGSWPSYINRAPLENGDIQATALSVRALELYGMPGRRAEWKHRIAEAREWLNKTSANSDVAKTSVARTTEDKVMLVSGLVWSGASADAVSRAARNLISEQRPDGGWAQLPTLESDAYATGKALSALHESGTLEASDEVYRRGVEYLLRTQEPDGTWKVRTRAFPFQPLKESGFPHGRDQWISAAATSWAAMALAYAIE